MIRFSPEKVALVAALGAVFIATSHDAQSSRPGHGGMAMNDAPVCSESPRQDAVERMKAIQSLRETQIEVEMMKKQQGAASRH